LGQGEIERSIEERILLGIYLCEFAPNPILELLRPEWNANIQLPMQEKLLSVPNFYPANIFKWKDEVSTDVEVGAFSLSFLIQPKLFIRIRQGFYLQVREKLKATNIFFEEISEACLAFENATKIEEVLSVNVEYVVQDYSSQRVAEFFELRNKQLDIRNTKSKIEQQNFEVAPVATQPPTSVWDCCAASGGKSIMVYDFLQNVQLTATDIRPSILQNLQNRFLQAGLKNYNAYVADLALPIKIINSPFDLVICDAPCSGSGTWARTPEQLFYFKEEEIEKYSLLQKKIAKNVIPHVKQNGFLLYVTCSVFQKENESVVKYILKNSFMQLVRMEVLKGYSIKADTMFAALFQLK